MNHEQFKKTLRSLPSKGADWIGLKKITSKIPSNQPLQGFNIISPEDNPLFTFIIYLLHFLYTGFLLPLSLTSELVFFL